MSFVIYGGAINGHGFHLASTVHPDFLLPPAPQSAPGDVQHRKIILLTPHQWVHEPRLWVSKLWVSKIIFPLESVVFFSLARKYGTRPPKKARIRAQNAPPQGTV